MKAVILWLALGALPALGGSFPAPIRLYADFQHEPPDLILGALQTELGDIMLPSGLGLEWRRLSAANGREVSTELAVVRFKGDCDLTEIQAVEGFPGPLGWTHISDGEILPFADINCDGVRIFLQRDLLRLPETERPAAYGRALARVLAHELYHVLAKTKKHGSGGLAKAAYSAQDLLATHFLFDKKQCDVLRSHQARLANGFVAGQ